MRVREAWSARWWSIQARITVALLVVGALTVAVGGPPLLQALAERRRAELVVSQNELADLLFQAVRHLGFERGRVTVVLGDAGPPEGSAANRAFIAEHRGAGEAALERALVRLRSGEPPAPMPLARLEAARRALAPLRAEVDREMVLPKAARDPALPDRWFGAASELISEIGEVLSQVTFAEGAHEGVTLRLGILKLKTLRFRDAAGPAVSLLSATMLGGARLPPAQAAAIAARRAEVGAHWRDLLALSQGLDHPAVEEAMAHLQVAYWERMDPAVARVLPEAAAGGPYSLGQPEFLRLGVAALEAASALSDATVLATREHVVVERRAAERMVQRATLLLGGALALLAITLLQVRSRVTGPLSRLTAALRALAAGDLEAQVPPPTGKEEVSALAESARSLRAAAVRQRQDAAARAEAEARLRAAERLATTGVLVRGLAHEINNPLSGVRAGVAFAREELRAGVDGAGRAEVDQALCDAAEGADRIRELVADLRAFAEEGPPAGTSPSALASAAQAACRVAGRELASCRSVEVGIPGPLQVEVPYPDLVQLLALLLINAGQSTGEQPNDVRLLASVEGDAVTVIVSDTGIGMDEATRSRAFEPFFTTRGVGRGRGLGLSVCHGIATAAGGDIALRSAPGAGTTVTVRLPGIQPGPRG